jgi:hypothetical protein
MEAVKARPQMVIMPQDETVKSYAKLYKFILQKYYRLYLISMQSKYICELDYNYHVFHQLMAMSMTVHDQLKMIIV